MLGDTDSNDSKSTSRVSDGHVVQVSMLRVLAKKAAESSEAAQVEIMQLVETAGLKDEREAQRYLFILEGQKLVSPYPAGDFTSNRWQITTEGLRCLTVINKSMPHAN